MLEYSNFFKDKTNVGFNLSIEMIEVQQNDKVIADLNTLFQDVIDGVNDFKIQSSRELVSNKKTSIAINSIDDVISKRFGIRFKHVMDNSSNYGVYTAPPKEINTLYSNNLEFYKYAKMMANRKEKNYKEIEQIDTTNNPHNYESLLFRYKKSVEVLEKQLKTKNVIIDLKNAVIKNLPKDYVGFIIADLKALVVDAGLSANELTAVLLHEVGHMFTHLEYSYRTIRNNSALIDSMQELMHKKNMSYKKSLLLSYKKVTGDDASDLKNKDNVTATISVVDRYIKSSFDMSEHNTASKDSEMLADKFSSRFGVGLELSEALKKMEKTINKLSTRLIFTHILFNIVANLILGLFLTFSLVGAIGYVIAGLIYLLFGYVMITMITYIATEGGETGDKTYDDKKRRVQRIKNELINQIRTAKLDRRTTVNLLQSISGIDSLLSSIPEDDKGTVQKLFTIFSFNGSRNEKLRKIEEMTEDLLNNNLHVAGARLLNI